MEVAIRIEVGQTVIIEGLTIISGTENQGSGIINTGMLTLKDVTVRENNSSGNVQVLNLNELTIDGITQLKN